MSFLVLGVWSLAPHLSMESCPLSTALPSLLLLYQQGHRDGTTEGS